MPAATEISWNDGGGVPDDTIMKGGAGGLIAVLDHCLPLVNWTTVQTGTNQRVYRNDTSVSHGFDLWVDDQNGDDATVHGFKTTTGLGVGDDPYPILADTSRFRKRFTATGLGANEGEWYFFGTGRAFWLMNRYRVTDRWTEAFFFGEPNTSEYDPTNGYNGLMISRASTSNNNNQVRAFLNATSPTTGYSWCRNVSAAAPAQTGARGVDGYHGSANYMGAINTETTGSATRDVRFKQAVAGDDDNEIRCRLPGLVVPSRPIYNNFDRFFGGGDLDPTTRTRMFNVYNLGQIGISADPQFWE